MSGASGSILVDSSVTLSGRGVREILPCRSVPCMTGYHSMGLMMIRSVASLLPLQTKILGFGSVKLRSMSLGGPEVLGDSRQLL